MPCSFDKFVLLSVAFLVLASSSMFFFGGGFFYSNEPAREALVIENTANKCHDMARCDSR